MKESIFTCLVLLICISLIVHLFLKIKKNKKRITYLKEEGLKYFFTVCSPLVSKWEPPKLPGTYFAIWIYDNECSIFIEKRKSKSCHMIIHAEYQGDHIYESESKKIYSLGQFETLIQTRLRDGYVKDCFGWMAYYSEKVKTSSLTVFK